MIKKVCPWDLSLGFCYNAIRKCNKLTTQKKEKILVFQVLIDRI